MTEIEKWNINLDQIGISEPHLYGYTYLTGCIARVMAEVNNKASEVNPILPVIRDNLKLPLETATIVKLNQEIFVELLLFAKSIDNDNLVQIPKNFINISFDRNTNPYFKEVENQWNINCRYRDLIKKIGEKIEQFISTKEQALALGYTHAHMKMNNSHEKQVYIGAAVLSNLQPSYLANVTNTLPFPNQFVSDPEKWIFSKELFTRLSDEKYGLDYKAANWIIDFHNFLFFKDANNAQEHKNKHETVDHFDHMITDIYKQIEQYQNKQKLDSKKFKFKSKYSGQEEWNAFVKQWQYNYTSDYGSEKVQDLFCIGEFYSHMSFRLLHAVLLFMERKKFLGVF
jgi:hypothetical protein